MSLDRIKSRLDDIAEKMSHCKKKNLKKKPEFQMKKEEKRIGTWEGKKNREVKYSPNFMKTINQKMQQFNKPEKTKKKWEGTRESTKENKMYHNQNTEQ